MLGANSRFTPLLGLTEHTVDDVAYAAYAMCLSGVATYLLDPETGQPVDGRSKQAQKQAAGDPVLYPADNIGTATRWHKAVVDWSAKNDGKVPNLAAQIQQGDGYIAMTGDGLEQWWHERFGRVPTRTWGNLLIIEGVAADVPRSCDGLQVAGVGNTLPLPPTFGCRMTATAVSAPPGLGAALAEIPPTA